MTRYRAVVLALLLMLLPSPLLAQSQVQFGISGFGGLHVPTAPVLDGIFLTDDFGEVAATFGQALGPAVGGRLAIWPSRRIGFEVEAAYLASQLEWDFLIPVAAGNLEEFSDEQSANAFVTSVNVQLALIRPPLEPLVIFVSGGVGFISRGGDGFDFFEDTGDVAGVFGLGLKYGVSRGLWLRADVKDYISSYKEADADAQLQNDFLITGGFEVTIGG
ncbi:MAG: hypothetical protein AMS25_06545 [Gemmatimonas sp. SM23_52]|nr:MAG: hypothetical protein AMS25_06545 [Gemmatimonas sp. SM23_52]